MKWKGQTGTVNEFKRISPFLAFIFLFAIHYQVFVKFHLKFYRTTKVGRVNNRSRTFLLIRRSYLHIRNIHISTFQTNDLLSTKIASSDVKQNWKPWQITIVYESTDKYRLYIHRLTFTDWDFYWFGLLMSPVGQVTFCDTKIEVNFF